ncbi:MAG: diphosphomevalonate decarboxylase [candidate division Zixibacteria bacterium]|nr:diphosphomevalonate decarboxylase [candidate division Zixibacteria bacterium]
MIKRVVARAYANIALVKYWGKQPGFQNVPATPSISLTLKALRTETIIERKPGGDDIFIINDKSTDRISTKRLTDYLNVWRTNKLIDGKYSIKSTNRFPTKSGLASSASGLAALSIGLSAFSRRKISSAKLSKLARIGSGSAARSIVGGLASLPNTANPSARLLIPFDEIPWGMVVVEVDKAEKEIGSRRGMELSRKFSPYYDAWVGCAERDYRRMLKAIQVMDFTRVGEITENNALAMHACMIATRPSLLYWTSATVAILQAVKRWRNQGLESYATIDAGPHVVILARQVDLEKVAGRARRLKGVKSVMKSMPAGGAKIIKCS